MSFLFQFKRLPVLIGCVIGLLLIIASTFLPTRSQPTPPNLTAHYEPEVEIVSASNLGQVFQEFGVEGSIAIYDKNNQRFYEHNPSRNTTPFFPASTFKILNALISLNTGVIQDDVSVLTWDGIVREIPAWNRDTNLSQAFKDSTVWFYQVLARKNGYERMQKFVEQVGYGNRQIGTADRVDHFWLDGPLKITPKQEIEFLQRLEQSNLPFSQRAINLVKDIMIIEKTPEYTLRGKTGWIQSVKPNIGWIVGYLEQKNNVYFFATNIVISDVKDATKRLEITRRSLKILGLL
jgi:beta-lactamase class D